MARWDRATLIEFLETHGVTPQIASRRANEVIKSELNIMSSGYRRLAESENDPRIKEIYTLISKELKR